MRSTTRRTRTLALAFALLPLLVMTNASVASAADFLSIPVSGVVRGAEGTVVQVSSEVVPADYIGQTCQVIGQTENQESIHESNDLLIETGGQVLTIANFENEGFVSYDSGEVVPLGPTIDVSVRLGPDGISSGGFRLRVICGDDEVGPAEPCVPTAEAPCTPATTVPACVPTAEVPCSPTTTVPACVPTAEAPCETTTAPPPGGPTIPEETTTTPVPAGPVIPAQPTPTTPTTAPTTAPTTSGPDVGAQLPVTGSSASGLVSIGVFLLASGFLISVIARPRSLVRR